MCGRNERGKLVSFKHSINFTRVQDVSICRSSSAVIQTPTPTLFNESRLISFVLSLMKMYGSKRPVPW